MLHVRIRKPLVVHVGWHVPSHSRTHLQIECIQRHESKRESAHQSSKQHQSCSYEQEEPEFFGSWFDVVFIITHEFPPQSHPSEPFWIGHAIQRRIRPPSYPRNLRPRRSATTWTRARRERARFRDVCARHVAKRRWRIFALIRVASWVLFDQTRVGSDVRGRVDGSWPPVHINTSGAKRQEVGTRRGEANG